MLCFILVMFACILPSYAVEGNGTNIPNMIACSDPEAVLKNRDEFFKCFDVYVNNSTKDEKLKCSTPLQNILIDYVKASNETCLNDTTRSENASRVLHDLIDFSLKNGNFKDIGDGVYCEKAIENDIPRNIACGLSEVGNIMEAYNHYSTMWIKSNFNFDMESCKETQNLKMCTLNTMRSQIHDTCENKIDHLVNVISLFDYMQEQCDKMEQTPEKKTGDEFFKCFDVYVHNSIKDEKLRCSTPLQNILNDYVKVSNETCYNGNIRSENAVQVFPDVIEFSLKNGNFKDFVETGGVKGVNAIKNHMSQCVLSEVGNIRGADNKYNTLCRKTKLKINRRSCKATQNIKTCTLKAMRSKINDKFENIDHLIYVSSLFDYMLERCSKMEPKWVENQHTSRMEADRIKIVKTGDGTTHAMLAVLLTLSILGFLYILFRDSRTANGRWKSPLEHIPMKERRRQSLGNNETGHEN